MKQVNDYEVWFTSTHKVERGTMKGVTYERYTPRYEAFQRIGYYKIVDTSIDRLIKKIEESNLSDWKIEDLKEKP